MNENSVYLPVTTDPNLPAGADYDNVFLAESCAIPYWLKAKYELDYK